MDKILCCGIASCLYAALGGSFRLLCNVLVTPEFVSPSLAAIPCAGFGISS